jgi:hypothetical protein
VHPDKFKDLIENLKDKMYIDVVSEPEDEKQQLIAVLFNTLTMYANLRGGQIPNLNYDYVDKVIGQASGLDWTKLFNKAVPPPPMQVGPDGKPVMGAPGQPGQPGIGSAPSLPMNPATNGSAPMM